MDDTAVVMLHYKNVEDSRECVDTLYSHTENKDLALYLVCNSPAEELIDAPRKYSGVTLIQNDVNEGYAQGNNTGIQAALRDNISYIVLINNDTIIPKNLVSGLVRYVKENKDVGIVSPKIYFAKGFEYHKERYGAAQQGKVLWYAGGRIDWANMYASHRGVDEVDQGQYDVSADTAFATGCCMLITRKLIEAIGTFDTNYFLYYEDTDYSLRALHAGFAVRYTPTAFLWHKNAASSDKPGSPLHMYYQSRNRLYFGYKYAPLRTKKSLFIESLRMIAKGGVQARAVKDYYIHRMGRAEI